MNVYESPTLKDVGSVRDLTLGGDTWREFSDEVRFLWWDFPAPGSGYS